MEDLVEDRGTPAPRSSPSSDSTSTSASTATSAADAAAGTSHAHAAAGWAAGAAAAAASAGAGASMNMGFTDDRERQRHGLRSLGDELQCAVCKELFVEASTLECGHSFCGPCIESWLKRDLSCPICRRQITKPPTRSMCLDKTVEILIQLAEEESRQTLLERRNRCVFKREKECAAQREMEMLLARAARAGVRVVTITKPWSEREQSRFQRGIEHHQGIAREAFCGLVGLTHEWVGRASGDQLLVAARNVGLAQGWSGSGSGSGVSDAPAPHTTTCMSKLRARLDMFISVG